MTNKNTTKKCLSFALLLSAVAALALAPQASAFPKYVKALKEGSNCGTCHVKVSGGGELNDYGKAFKAVPDHKTDPAKAIESLKK